MNKYRSTITPIAIEDGGGYLIEFPDLPGCMSDGKTVLEAIKNGDDAVEAWLEAAEEIVYTLGICSICSKDVYADELFLGIEQLGNLRHSSCDYNGAYSCRGGVDD